MKLFESTLFSRLLAFLLLIGLLGQVIAAPAPVTDSFDVEEHDDSLESRAPKPKLPSVAEVKKHLKVARDAAIFYSGPNEKGKPSYEVQVNNLINKRDYLKHYKTVRKSFEPSNWAEKYLKDNKVSGKNVKKFWEVASKAFAEEAKGNIYVLLPEDEGTKWHKGTIWDKTEWPTLEKSGDVETVIRINPDNENKTTLKGKK